MLTKEKGFRNSLIHHITNSPDLDFLFSSPPDLDVLRAKDAGTRADHQGEHTQTLRGEKLTQKTYRYP